jgi:hypothetical protein
MPWWPWRKRPLDPDEEKSANFQVPMKVEDGKVVAYRARVNLSFKYGSD